LGGAAFRSSGHDIWVKGLVPPAELIQALSLLLNSSLFSHFFLASNITGGQNQKTLPMDVGCLPAPMLDRPTPRRIAI
jgi:hypothetical protein